MVFLDLLLDGSGKALPERATVKSPAAISRFLNHASWDTRKLCRMLREHALHTVQSWYRQHPQHRPRLELKLLEFRGSCTLLVHPRLTVLF